MKIIFKTALMLFGYIGFSQSVKTEDQKLITFPNGDESITIVSTSGKAKIQFTVGEEGQKYQALELVSHEMKPQTSSAPKDSLIETFSKSQVVTRKKKDREKNGPNKDHS